MVTQGDREYQTIVLAAHLHDIGKLIHRGKFLQPDTGRHAEFSGDLPARAFGGMHQRESRQVADYSGEQCCRKRTNPRKGIEEVRSVARTCKTPLMVAKYD